MVYETGKLYETRKSGRTPIGVEIPIRIISAAAPSLIIYGSEKLPANVSDMADIDNGVSTPYTAAGYIRVNSLPRYIAFIGTADSIEVSNVALDDKGAIT